jgi:hypothetical protein
MLPVSDQHARIGHARGRATQHGAATSMKALDPRHCGTSSPWQRGIVDAGCCWVVNRRPIWLSRRRAVSSDVESVYVLSTCQTPINATVGLCTLGVMWACGLANPLLWGVLALVLNDAPIVGAAFGIVIFLMASVVSLGITWWALLPVGLNFGAHLIKGEPVTPMLVARRFTINPVAVILALIF